MLNLDEPNDSRGTCPSRTEGRRNKKKKKRSRIQTTSDNDVHSDAAPQAQTRRRRAAQSNDSRTSGSQDGRQHSANTNTTSRHEEMRLYMDKLRELIPQLPKHGKMAQSDLIQTTIEYICELQQTLENHPLLQGLDPRVIAAPGNVLPPMQMQQLLLQQRTQQRLIQLQQQQLRRQMQQQYQQRDQQRDQFQQSDQYRDLEQYDQLEQREYIQPCAQAYQPQQPRQYPQQPQHEHQQQIPQQQQHQVQQYQQHQVQQYQQQQQPQQTQQKNNLYPRRPLTTLTTGRPALQARRDSKLSRLAASVRLQRTGGSAD